MKTRAQAAVIGGGVIGCSILYHLAKLGWKDVVLLERDELTSGSTWHAAGNIHGLHDNNEISQLQYYTMRLYGELEKETGQSCGLHRTGSLYLAQTENREHQLRLQAAKAKYFGVEFHEMGKDEAKKLHPFINFDGIRVIMFEADGGSIDPSGVPAAYAAGAKALGAEIHRFTPVTATIPQPDGTWIVETEKGNVHVDWVVNAAGLWGREVARMAGVDLPLMPAEHQYFVTETIPEIEELGHRLPSVADRDGEYYLRQEGSGLLVGAYERDMRFWAEDGTPSDFGHDLFEPDLDRITGNVMRAIERLPIVEKAGIKRVINGPMIWSPDSSALFGPVPELRNYFCCNGVIPGFSQSGGLGLMAAQWIIEGETKNDVFAWDLARFGAWASGRFVKERVRDQYSNRFAIHFPYEEREAGRPARKRPAYEAQRDMGCVFGFSYGWEHPLWFAPEGVEPREEYGFARQPWFEHVGGECAALRSGVGIIDISNFAKYQVTGEGAGDWLSSLLANRLPGETGRSCLAPLIGKRGGVAGDFSVTKLDEGRFFMVGSGVAERYHQRFFRAEPLPSGVGFESLTDRWCGFNVAGPKSRELMRRLTQTDVSNEGFPFMRSRRISVAGVEGIAIRVSFTGDLGWEIYVEEEDQVKLYSALLEAGRDLGARPVGSRALLSLRVEKGYGSWGREYSPAYWPHEVGLDRLVKMDKGPFMNRGAYEKVSAIPPREKLVMLEVDASGADASGGEPVFLKDGTPVGRVSSGAYGFTVEKSLALSLVKSEHARAGRGFDVYILGRPHHAALLECSPFDPKSARLRS